MRVLPPSSNRVASWLAVTALGGVLLSAEAYAAPTLRYSTDQRGDMALIGNTLAHDCRTSATTPVVGTAPASWDTSECGSNKKDVGSAFDSGVDVLWQSDYPTTGAATADASISVSNAGSTAVLSLPVGATVTYARLYWAAMITTSDPADSTVTVSRPGAGGFSTTVVADIPAAMVDSGGDRYYQGSADVTALVQAQQNGAYRVSGVLTRDPVGKSSETHFAAWSLVVFYELPTEPSRNLALFDGLDLVTSTTSASATVSGFTVPQAGFNAKLAVIAYEGDSVVPGDTLTFNGQQLTDANNPSDNFFNSTRSNLGSPVSVTGDLPQLTGSPGSLSGLDIDVVDVTSTLAPGATSATTLAQSIQDTYLIGAFVTSISTLKPDFIQTSKTWRDVNGGSIEAGDVIEYSITTRNSGTDTAQNVVLSDPLPAGITYVPGTIEITAGANAGPPKTDAAGDDQAEYDAATRTITVRLGTGANGTTGGTMTTTDPATTVIFRVTIDPTANGEIANQAMISATGQIGGQTQTFPSSSTGNNGQPTEFVIAPDTSIVSGPATLTNATTATFDFDSATAGVTYECRLDAAAGFSGCSDPVTFSGLAAGSHTLEVRAVLSGTPDSTPATHVWTVDLTPPTTEVVSGPPALTSASGSTFDFSSNEAGATFECQLDGSPTGFSACTDPVSFSLSEGDHTLAVRARDPAGNVDGTPEAWSWTVDGTPPTVSIVSGPASLTSNTTASFDLSSDDSSATFECRLDAATAGFTACAEPLSFEVADGSHLLEVRARDLAGNSSTAIATHSWTVDSTAPTTTLVSGPAPMTNATTATFDFGSDEPGTFECRLDVDPAGFTSCTDPVSFTVSTGEHTLEVRARDLAGNVDATPAQHVWTVDAVAPDTFITAGPTGLVRATDAEFTFSSDEGGVQYECALDAGAFTACLNPAAFTVGQGDHTLRVRAIDAAGNPDPSPASRSWSVDSIAPGMPMVIAPAAGTTVASRSPEILGSADADTVVTISIDDVVLGTATVAADGSWTFTPPAPLDEGTRALSIVATDTAGNASPEASSTFTIDVTAPDAIIDSGPPALTAGTDATFTFRSDDPDAELECALDGATFATCTSPLTLNGLPQGDRSFAVRARDLVGNVDSTPATWSWTIDTTPPTVSIVSGPPSLTRDGSATFALSSNDPDATFECRLDADAAGFAVCVEPVTFVVGDGDHTLEVRARDAVGNFSSPTATHTWTVDSTEPTTSFVSAPPTLSDSTAATFDFASNEAGAFECRLDGAAAGFTDCSDPLTIVVANGEHTLEVRARDLAGNVDGSPASHTWTVDASRPDTFIVSGPIGLVRSTSAEFSFSSDETGVGYECALDGAAFSGCSNPVTLSVGEGEHTLLVRAVDPAGNVDDSPASRTWSVDSIPPGLPMVFAPADGTHVANVLPQFIGSADPGTTVTLQLDGVELGVTPVASDGSWTFTPTVPLAEGPRGLTVFATDLAGNVGPEVTSSFAVDVTPPDAALDSGPGPLTSETEATFTFTSNEDGAFECSVDDGEFATCTSPATFGGLLDGEHVFRVRAIDLAGNVDSEPAEQLWTVDTEAPETQLLSAPPPATAETTATFTFASDDANARFECDLDGAGFTLCSSPLVLQDLGEGGHTFAVRAIDEAGNPDPSAETFAWSIDLTPPAAPAILAPTSGALLASRTIAISGSAEPGAQVTVTLDDTVTGFRASATVAGPWTVAADGSGAWSVSNVGPLSDGAFTVGAVARDGVGNASPPSSASFRVDGTAPDTTVDSATAPVTSADSATFTLGADESPVSFECSLDGAAFATCSDPHAVSSLPEGDHVFAVRAIDEAGNIDASPATFAWTVDRTAPGTTIASGPSSPSQSASATFTLESNEAGVRFECALDGDTFSTCASPFDVNGLTAGDHTLVVRAVDLAGNVDATPATFEWTVNGDTDGDGLLDLDEAAHGTDPQNPDSDGDGLGDGLEVSVARTSPTDADSDDDGLLDGTEDANGDGIVDAGETDPAKLDTDGDGLADGLELGLSEPEANGVDTDPAVFVADLDPATRTDPLLVDSDGGSVRDGYEDANHNGRIDAGETDPNQPADDVDADSDGIDNDTERAHGLDPFDDDSDDDGVPDGDDGLDDTDGDGRIDALDRDSDDDGVDDGTELGVTESTAPAGTDPGAGFRPDFDPSTTTDPKNPDSDGDGLTDGQEDPNGNGRYDAPDALTAGGERPQPSPESNPIDVDSDRGGIPDGIEREHGLDPNFSGDDWGVAGRGCSASGSTGFGPFSLALVALVVLRKRSTRKVVVGTLLGAALIAPSVASAQAQAPTSTAIDVQQFKPGPGERDVLQLHSAQVVGHLSTRVGLVATFADDPLGVVDPISGEYTRMLVDHQLTFDLVGSVSLFGRFEVGVSVPLTMQATDSQPLDGEQLRGFGLGDLRVVPKARVYRVGETIELALALPFVLPTSGGNSFLGGAGLSVQPQLIGEWSPGPSSIRTIANVGMNFRGEERLHNLRVGNELTYGLGFELPLGMGERELAVSASLVGRLGLSQNDPEERPLELLAGAKLNVMPGLRVQLGGGPGLTSGYGTPTYRIVVGVDWKPGELALPGRSAPAKK